MADYSTTTLTNYFSVTDEEKLRSIISSCAAEDEIEIFEESKEDGTKKIGFGCYGIIYGITGEGEDGDENIDAFYKALQSIVCQGDAILITEIGREKLNNVGGSCIVITSDEMRTLDIWDKAIDLARDMLDNKNFYTKYAD